MSKNGLKRRVEDLEKEADPKNLYVLAIEWQWEDALLYPYYETRMLMEDDGSKKGSFIRGIEPGELHPTARGGMRPWKLQPETPVRADSLRGMIVYD